MGLWSVVYLLLCLGPMEMGEKTAVGKSWARDLGGIFGFSFFGGGFFLGLTHCFSSFSLFLLFLFIFSFLPLFFLVPFFLFPPMIAAVGLSVGYGSGPSEKVWL